MNHKSRIEEYKKLREEIENIDVYSFDDPKKYPIKKNENIVEIHDLDEKDEYPEEKKIEKDHIKKNTLSLSIDELIRRHEAYTETLQKEEIEKKLKELLNIKLDLKDIFNNFYQSEYSKYKDKVNDKYLYYEDACIFLYIKSLLVGFNTNHVIKEIVIDEAQDYNKLQYLIIKKTFKTSNYTILGDTNQTINPYYKYNSLEELTSIFESSKYITLTKTYRSTGKIIDYTNKILGLNHVTAIRNDKASDIIFRNNITKNDFLTDINNLKTISKSIAIITKNDKEAEKVYNMLKDDLDIMLIDGFGHIKRDLVVVPSYVAKGLEFDSVIIYTDTNNKYQEKDKYLFYVACTRAQHNLIIYNNSK